MQTEDPKPSIGELFAAITNQLKSLVQGEIKLAKTQAKDKFSPFVPAIAMFAGAGLFALLGLCWLIYTGYLALTLAVAPWLAGLIVTVAIFLLTGTLAFIGKHLIDTASKRKITLAENIKADVAAVKEGIGR